MTDTANSNTEIKESVASPAPIVSETLSIVEQAREERTKIEAALKESKEVLAKNEQAVAKLILGGRAEAGSVQKTKEQTEQEKIDAQVKEALNRFK